MFVSVGPQCERSRTSSVSIPNHPPCGHMHHLWWGKKVGAEISLSLLSPWNKEFLFSSSSHIIRTQNSARLLVRLRAEKETILRLFHPHHRHILPIGKLTRLETKRKWKKKSFVNDLDVEGMKSCAVAIFTDSPLSFSLSLIIGTVRRSEPEPSRIKPSRADQHH